jgi:hypothetical protein
MVAGATMMRGLAVFGGAPSSHARKMMRVPMPICVGWGETNSTVQLAPTVHVKVTGVTYDPAAQPIPATENGCAAGLLCIVTALDDDCEKRTAEQATTSQKARSEAPAGWRKLAYGPKVLLFKRLHFITISR